MSYFAFAARSAISATSFTIVGNACKIISVFINVVIWEKHASRLGLIFLAVCLCGSAIYKQAPLREENEDIAVEHEKQGLCTEDHCDGKRDGFGDVEVPPQTMGQPELDEGVPREEVLKLNNTSFEEDEPQEQWIHAKEVSY